MYLCYVDESGSRDPRLSIPRKDGSSIPGDPIYVLTAVCIFERNWHSLAKTLERFKRELADKITSRTGLSLQRTDLEIKSNWIRNPNERRKRPFLSHATADELTALTDLYFAQLRNPRGTVLSVVVDKRTLPPDASQQSVHTDSWERLLELVESFMRTEHDKHQAIMVNDDVSPELNLLLADVHARLRDRGTSKDTWLRHVCEMPMFVRSELSTGVQLADLCSYTIYRAFRDMDMDYPFFRRILPYIWNPVRSPRPSLPQRGLVVLANGDSPSDLLAQQLWNGKGPDGNASGPFNTQ